MAFRFKSSKRERKKSASIWLNNCINFNYATLAITSFTIISMGMSRIRVRQYPVPFRRRRRLPNWISVQVSVRGVGEVSFDFVEWFNFTNWSKRTIVNLVNEMCGLIENGIQFPFELLMSIHVWWAVVVNWDVISIGFSWNEVAFVNSCFFLYDPRKLSTL